MKRADLHERCRELISARLDGALTLEDEWALALHLLSCERCRLIERDYGEQRRSLRALPAPPPPRDLWARTSAALDREIVDGSRRRRSRLDDLSNPRRLPGMLMVSLASMAMAVVLVVTQLAPPPTTGPDETSGRPTPFSVPGQALAYIGADPLGLTVYRTRVDQACPSSASDCFNATAAVPARVSYPSSFEPSNLALSPTGDRLAIMGWDRSREDVFGVVLMPPLENADVGAQPSQSPSGGGTPTGTPAGSSSTTGPGSTIGPGSTARPGSTTAPASLVPTVSPLGATPRPAITALATTSTGELVMVAILEDVRGAGSPPAWSSDGDMLAFSAMPADRSHGPNVYVWQVGDERARPITSDHGAYFASWWDGQIVASRAAYQPATPSRPFEDPAGFGEAPIEIVTVLIDPLTGEERPLEVANTWLPQVSPAGGYAVGWRGTLVPDGPTFVPRSGALYLVPWPEADPLADEDDGDGEAGTDDETPGGDDAGDDPGDDRAATDHVKQPVEAEPEPTPTPRLTLPTVTETPDDEQPSPDPDDASPEPAEATPDPSSEPSPDPSSEPSPNPSSEPSPDPSSEPSPTAPFVPIEPERDSSRHPVTSWRVMWSSDGTVVGYWIADGPTSSWGELTVIAIDLVNGQPNHAQPIVAPTLARRGFTIGSNRVVWAAPTEGVRGGELRVRFWGPDGFGDLRFVPPTGVVAAL